MNRKKKNEPAVTPEDKEVVDQLFASLPGGAKFDFDSVEHITVGRIAAAAAELGGMASVYGSTADNTLSISVRVGDSKRSYEYPNASAANEALPRLLDALLVAVGRRRRGE